MKHIKSVLIIVAGVLISQFLCIHDRYELMFGCIWPGVVFIIFEICKKKNPEWSEWKGNVKLTKM